eukprot:TRINITY_DN18240_c0_g1_i1.p1 TRINITY_DN18240_c0_g1~~TRINITY_DN18240_c0_g1_i1.p1  ORF type:complete len:207 (-),score=31.03 TRINITY_DN18240_c0_g1_i1:115-735(-)
MTCTSIFKVMVVGDSLSGKTSILLRFTDENFQENALTNNEPNFKMKIFQVGSENLKVQFWDFDENMVKIMTSSYFQQAQAVLVVFSVYVQQTLDELHLWLEQVNNSKCRPHTIKLLVGHKFHSEGMTKRVITTEMAKDLAIREGFDDYFEVEAKTGEHVEGLFTEMVKKQRKLITPQKIPLTNSNPTSEKENDDPPRRQGCSCVVQ